jgi:uncharacterized protein YndB with AHSA1/START domain
VSDDEPLLKSVLLPCGQQRAFALFTEHIHEWWPPERKHIKGADSVVLLTQEHFRERAVDGRQVELGRVREWSPPARIVLDFYPGTDAGHPTDVTIAFAPEGDGTRVTVTHRPTAASLALWKQRVGAFAKSWDVVLPALRSYCVR